MSLIQVRQQTTIQAPVKVHGFGLFCGDDVTLEFCPAPENHGIAFLRTDIADAAPIPAVVENVIQRPRCTVISAHGSTVAVTEHVLAALAGLQIDNCLVRINASEPPIGDGSSQHFIESLLSVGIQQLDAKRDCLVIDQTELTVESDLVGVAVQPPKANEYQIGFVLDYGRGAVPTQAMNIAITPDRFQSELANCRTFVLEAEVDALQKTGIGLRATPQNVLVINEHGPVENSFRHSNECVRHKILDCVGDFALLGCDVQGRFTATRSGHRLNHSLIKKLRANYLYQLRIKQAVSPLYNASFAKAS